MECLDAGSLSCVAMKPYFCSKCASALQDSTFPLFCCHTYNLTTFDIRARKSTCSRRRNLITWQH